jgi:hypothetical protein
MYVCMCMCLGVGVCVCVGVLVCDPAIYMSYVICHIAYVNNMCFYTYSTYATYATYDVYAPMLTAVGWVGFLSILLRTLSTKVVKSRREFLNFRSSMLSGIQLMKSEYAVASFSRDSSIVAAARG